MAGTEVLSFWDREGRKADTRRDSDGGRAAEGADDEGRGIGDAAESDRKERRVQRKTDAERKATGGEVPRGRRREPARGGRGSEGASRGAEGGRAGGPPRGDGETPRRDGPAGRAGPKPGEAGAGRETERHPSRRREGGCLCGDARAPRARHAHGAARRGEVGPAGGRREGEGSGGAGRARGAGRKRGGAAGRGPPEKRPDFLPRQSRKREPGRRAGIAEPDLGRPAGRLPARTPGTRPAAPPGPSPRPLGEVGGGRGAGARPAAEGPARPPPTPREPAAALPASVFPSVKGARGGERIPAECQCGGQGARPPRVRRRTETSPSVRVGKLRPGGRTDPCQGAHVVKPSGTGIRTRRCLMLSAVLQPRLLCFGHLQATTTVNAVGRCEAGRRRALSKAFWKSLFLGH